MGGKFHDIHLGNDFFTYDIKSTSNKSKNQQIIFDQTELHQTKKLMYSKGNKQQNEKTTYRIGEHTCQSYI